MNKRDFVEAYAKLQKGFATDDTNPMSYGCVGSRRCAGCMFCKDCEGCYRCSHCISCIECSNCVHCLQCESCHSSQHCVQSKLCTGSAYLYLSDCTYCFGCVGLAKKDFHILNEPYPRAQYFEIVKKLKRELGLE